MNWQYYFKILISEESPYFLHHLCKISGQTDVQFGRYDISQSTLFSRVSKTTLLKFVAYAGCGKTTLFSMVGIAKGHYFRWFVI